MSRRVRVRSGYRSGGGEDRYEPLPPAHRARRGRSRVLEHDRPRQVAAADPGHRRGRDAECGRGLGDGRRAGIGLGVAVPHDGLTDHGVDTAGGVGSRAGHHGRIVSMDAGDDGPRGYGARIDPQRLPECGRHDPGLIADVAHAATQVFRVVAASHCLAGAERQFSRRPEADQERRRVGGRIGGIDGRLAAEHGLAVPDARNAVVVSERVRARRRRLGHGGGWPVGDRGR